MPQQTRKPGRPKDPGLETRRTEEILDAAALVFAEFGFAATQVQTIADRLKIGNGTVYRYFPTKEALFLAAVERGLRELTLLMDRVLDTDHDAFVMLGDAVREYLCFFQRRPHMAELFIQERAAFPHHHRPLYFDTKEVHEQKKHDMFFEQLRATGRLRSISQERFMSVIGDLLYGTILTNLLTGRAVDPDAQAEDILDVILHGVMIPEAVSANTSKQPRSGKKVKR